MVGSWGVYLIKIRWVFVIVHVSVLFLTVDLLCFCTISCGKHGDRLFLCLVEFLLRSFFEVVGTFVFVSFLFFLVIVRFFRVDMWWIFVVYFFEFGVSYGYYFLCFILIERVLLLCIRKRWVGLLSMWGTSLTDFLKCIFKCINGYFCERFTEESTVFRTPIKTWLWFWWGIYWSVTGREKSTITIIFRLFFKGEILNKTNEFLKLFR